MELLGKCQAPSKTQRKVVLQRKVGVLALSQMLGCWLYCPVVRLATSKLLTHLLPVRSLELVVVVEEMALVSIYLCVFLPEKKYHIWEFLISSSFSSHHLYCIMI